MSQLLNVLLIEDSEDDALLILRELRRSHFDLVWERVQTAEQLHRMLATRTWDVIISDHHLPGFNAPVALEIVQQSQLDIPFIVVSGTIGEYLAVDMMKAGAHDYLMKDNLTRLPEAVRRELRDAQTRQERRQAEVMLARRDRYLTTLIEVQHQLLAARINQTTYERILTLLGSIADVDRIYVFENHTDEAGNLLMHQQAVWYAATNQPPVNPPTPYLCYSEVAPHWREILAGGGVIKGSVVEFPEARAILATHSIRSILVIPLITKGGFFGFMGFGDAEETKYWDSLEVDLLSSTAAAIALAREREQVSQSLARLNRELEDRIQHRTADLQESEAKLQAILNFAPEVMYVKDMDGRHILVNQAFLNFFNCSLEEVIGKTNREFFSPDIAELLDANDYLLTSTGQFHQQEENIRIGGNLHIFLSNKFLLYDREGLPYALCGISTDITDRKHTEQALQQSEEKFRQLAENIPSVFWISNADCSEILYVSPAYEKIWGRTCESLYRSPTNFFQAIHPDDQPKVATFLTNQAEGYDEEYRIIQPDGTLRWIRDRAFPIRNAEGQVYRLAGLAQDITDRKLAEEALYRSNTELARATRLKDEFLANMSHELRTPLNAILGMTEGLQENVFGEINDRQLGALQTIERSGFHLLELINDILDVAKIEAGQIELDPVPTPVAPLCHSSLSFIKQQALKKHIQLDVHLPPHLPDLLVDQRRIRQVLINLLNNAVKFTPSGGRITLEASPCPIADLHPNSDQSDQNDAPAQNFLRIAVTDTGIGIAPEQINKLFQPFIQVDSALNRQYTGTGLGLALVKRIVELHGGQVGLTSQVGVGSCFSIDLPCVAAPASAEPFSKLELPNASVPGFDQPKAATPLILLVETNEASISTISSYLRAKGYRIVVAKDGQAALSLAQSDCPHVILIDVQIPEVDGIKVMQQIRFTSTLVNVAIIALTASGIADDRERYLAAGANEVLIKPVKLKQLATQIQQLLAPAKPG